MDPFSLATGIAGLVSLAAQVGSSLSAFQHSYRGARESYDRLASELAAVLSTLSMLQIHIKKGLHLGATMLLKEPVDQCAATLAKIRDECVPNKPMSKRRRWVWAYSDERRVLDFIVMLERYKGMFNVALNLDLSGQVDRLQLGISKLLVGQESDRQEAEATKNDDQLSKILDWLKPVDVKARLETILQLRQQGTCQWVLDSPVFKDWEKSTSGSLLWLHGIPGNGKTVISSVLMHHLVEKCTRDDVVLYAFCEFRDKQTIDPVVILRTFVSQLLRAYPGRIIPDFADLVDEERKRESPPNTISSLEVLIRRAARRFLRVHVVIDGLDECKNRGSLLVLLTLVADEAFNVCVASRPEPDIQEALSSMITISLQMQEERAHVHNDIVHHINRELDLRRELRRLPKKLRDEIRATLESKASGMFRLVQCQLDILVRKSTSASMTRALQNLPTTLMEMYDRILERIDEDNIEIARRALRWLADVKRPLQLAQLVEAIRIEPCGGELNETDCYVLESVMVLEILSSLVTYDSNDGIISLSHMSVLEYLMSSNLLKSPFKHYHLPALSVLANEMFPLLLGYMLIDDFDRPQFEAEDELRHFVAKEHPFYDYATVYWIEYIQDLDISRPATLEALLRFIQSSESPLWLADQISATNTSGAFNNPVPGRPHPLRGLCWHGIDPFFTEYIASIKFVRPQTRILEGLLDVGLADVNRKHMCWHCSHPLISSMRSVEISPLAFAFELGNLAAARLLLQRGAIPGDAMANGSTVLHSATRSGLPEAVHMLLKNPGVDVHARDESGQTAYMIAAQMDAKETVQCLVNHGASKADLFEEALHGLQEDEILQVGLCLARMLRAQVKLVPVILDLAEYWAVIYAERNDPQGVVFRQDSPDEPYISLKISGRSKEPLRCLVFTTTSHDQGWSDHKSDIGTYRGGCSWFEVGNEGGNRHKLQNNLHGSDKKHVHRNVWVRNASSPAVQNLTTATLRNVYVSAISDWMGAFRSGNVLNVYAKQSTQPQLRGWGISVAYYPGWENHVYAVKVVAYTACL
ncbi:hypothetical protein FB451DRAFT_1213777 [Mycena latifolia]|nr:hypothetical protein FB451DRAFT_1213777 [Mycena latifolia]